MWPGEGGGRKVADLGHVAFQAKVWEVRWAARNFHRSVRARQAHSSARSELTGPDAPTRDQQASAVVGAGSLGSQKGLQR